MNPLQFIDPHDDHSLMHFFRSLWPPYTKNCLECKTFVQPYGPQVASACQDDYGDKTQGISMC